MAHRFRRFFRRIGRFFRRAAEAIWDAITTVVNAVIEVLESIFGWVLSAISYIVELLFAIPIIGRLIRWLWNIILTVVWFIVGFLDFLLSLIGIRPEKKLRVCTIILRDEMGNPTTTVGQVITALQNAINIYASEANVRIIPSRPFEFDSGFASRETATASWVHIKPNPSDKDILDVSCDLGAAREDLGVPGTKFELLANSLCFYGNFRRLIGYGAPVVIFIVRSVSRPGDVGPNSTLGCSLGPLTDYVTIEGSNPICIAHELGHACNLRHRGGGNNLMNPNTCMGTQLRRGQIATLRASRHVTYF